MNLLIELFSEEIPARMQPKAAADLKRLMTSACADAGLTYAAAEAFAGPRRLTLAMEGLLAETPTLTEERRGPRTDAPDKAIEGFLRSTGVTRDQLTVKADKKGEVYMAAVTTPGRPAAEVVAEALEATIRGFPWPKSMRWGAGSLRWVRPLRRILAILNDEAGATVVPLTVDGLTAGDLTEGHRVMAPGAVPVTGFEHYEATLAARHTLLRQEDRVARIRHDAEQLAFAAGLEVVPDEALLQEIAGLVDWPVTLMGRIEERFLALPPEVLQTSMREHQKFLSVRDRDGRITAYVTVANRETADGGATILAGNGRVLAARLADAAFFWDNDLRKVREGGMAALAAPLAATTFHAKLGSQADRIARIAALARNLAPAVGAAPDLAAEAAKVAKADLASEMVFEFPELQGVMGRYYAAAAGHDDGVAEACEAHHRPLGPSDAVPTAPVSVAVALADKLDMLAGFWAIGERPTGSGDPYALRRAALGVVRIVLERGLRLHLDRLLDAQILRLRLGEDGVKGALLDTLAVHGFHAELEARIAEIGDEAHAWLTAAQESGAGEISDDLVAFFHGRLKVALRDQGVRHDVIDACLPMPNRDDLTLLVARVRALQAFLGTEDGANLLAGYRRASNIVAAEEKKDGNVEYSGEPEPRLAREPAETALFAALDTAEAALAPALAAEDFAGAMTALAGLRAPIDTFFDEITVNADEAILRRNRLCLLTRIRVVMHRVAQFGAIEG